MEVKYPLKMSMTAEANMLKDVPTGDSYANVVVANSSRHGSYAAIMKNTGQADIKYKIVVSGDGEIFAEQVAEATLAKGATVAINKTSIGDLTVIQAKNSVAGSNSTVSIFFKLIPMAVVV